MMVKKVFYSRGIPLEAEIILPKNKNKVPCVVLCHGHSRHKNDGLDVLADMLGEAGIASMRFDFRGCGKDAENRYELHCTTDWPDDLMNAISYLKAIPGIDSEKIGACGISMGASTVIYTGGMDQRIKSIAAMAGISDGYVWLQDVWRRNGGEFKEFVALLEEDSVRAAVTGCSGKIPTLDMYHKDRKEEEELLREAFYNSDVNSFVSLGSLKSLLNYKPIEKCPHLTQPVFFLHGDKDDIVPFEESQKMYDAAASQKKVIKKYPGVEHNIPIDPCNKIPFADIVEWYLETLA